MLISSQLARFYEMSGEDTNLLLAEELAAGQRRALSDERDFWLSFVRCNALAALRHWQQAAEAAAADFLSAEQLIRLLNELLPNVRKTDFEQEGKYRISVIAGHEVEEDFHMMRGGSELPRDKKVHNAHHYSAVREFSGRLPQAFAYAMQAYERARAQASEQVHNCYYAGWHIGEEWYAQGLSLEAIKAKRLQLWQALSDTRAKSCTHCQRENLRKELRCQHRPFWYTQMRLRAQVYDLSEGELWQALENLDVPSLGYYSHSNEFCTGGFFSKDPAVKALFAEPYEDSAYTPLCFMESFLLPPICFHYSDYETNGGLLYYQRDSGGEASFSAACRQFFFAEICRIAP